MVAEKGKISYEKAEVEAEKQSAVAKKSTVLVSVRFLDGRHFFTCPAAV